MRHLRIIMILMGALVSAAGFISAKGSAVLMVHFGTSYDETRGKTIDAINRKVQEEFPDLIFREAYSSRKIVKKLKNKGVEKSTPGESLLKLASEGVDTVYVQPTFVLNGVEYKMLADEVETMRQFFKHIQLGSPLLYDHEDSGIVADALISNYSPAKGSDHVIFVGHGSPGPYNAIYSQLDYQLKNAGHGNMHVSTIEGYPTLETAEKMIREAKGKNVTLVPLLFVAGDHASNDIAVEYKDALEKKGYKVNVVLKGLGEMAEMQDQFISNLKKIIK